MKKIIKSLALAGSALLVAKGIDNRIDVSHYKISSPKIPKGFQGFKIVQLSDYHCETLPGLTEEVANLRPDLIVCTGDMVNDDGSYQPAVTLIRRLVEIAPVYMITGNHDLWRSDYSMMERDMVAAGGQFLHNRRITLNKNGERIALTGIDDPFTRDAAQISKHLKESLDAVAAWDGFDILLFHRANLLDQLKNSGFDLILSGHMHGGQFRLPGGKGVLAPKSGCGSNSRLFFPKYVGGRYRCKNTDMIVSRGLGNPMIIPRFYNRPEIVLCELNSEQ